MSPRFRCRHSLSQWIRKSRAIRMYRQTRRDPRSLQTAPDRCGKTHHLLANWLVSAARWRAFMLASWRAFLLTRWLVPEARSDIYQSRCELRARVSRTGSFVKPNMRSNIGGKYRAEYRRR